MSEQFWPDWLRDASDASRSRMRELSGRWQLLTASVAAPARAGVARARLGVRTPLRSGSLWFAEALGRLQPRFRVPFGLLRVHYRSRKIAVWASAFALLTAVELVIAYPMLVGPSREAVQSVDRAARAIVSKATGGEQSGSQAGAAADRGRAALGKGPAGSPEPENRSSGGVPFAGGEIPDEEESDVLGSSSSEESSTGSGGSSSGARDRATPTRRNEPESGGPSGKREAAPETRVSSPQPQSPPSPPPASPVSPPPPPSAAASPPPPPPPPPAAPSTTTTTTTNNPPPPPPPQPTPPPSTTTTVASAPPSPPPATTTTTTDNNDDCKRRHHRRCGDDDDDDDDDDD